MTATLPTSSLSAQATPLEKRGQVKATLRVPSFRQAMKDGILALYGSLKSAAITMHVDDSQLLKEWTKGNFSRFDQYADAEGQAFVAAFVDEALGRGQDPKLQARALIRDLRARCDELEAVIERLI